MSLRSITPYLIIAVLLVGWISLPSAQAAEIGVTANGRTLVLTGFIQEWDHCVVARLLAVNPGIRQARINSTGGYAWAGAYIGRLFGWAGLEAVVPKGAVADSAAGVAVLGAPRRVIVGQLGLHGPWLSHPDQSPLSRITLAETSAEMSSVLELGGMPTEQINLAMKTSRNRLYRINGAAAALFHHLGQAEPARIQHTAETCRAIS